MRGLPFFKPKNKPQFAGMNFSNDASGGSYTLPTATASRLGGVKIGSGINVSEDGTISASGGGGGLSFLSFNMADFFGTPPSPTGGGYYYWYGNRSNIPNLPSGANIVSASIGPQALPGGIEGFITFNLMTNGDIILITKNTNVLNNATIGIWYFV